MTNLCTTSECGNQTATWLCSTCVSDLQAWIDKALLLVPELDVTIARLDVTRPGNSETRNANKAGSAAPGNLDAMQLKINLQTVDPDAKVYALDPNASGLAWLIRDWTTKAELLISGPEPAQPRNTSDLKKRLAKEIPSELTTPKLLEWLKVTQGIAVRATTIWKWAERGHITRTNETGHPTYSPAAVLIRIKENTAS